MMTAAAGCPQSTLLWRDPIVRRLQIRPYIVRKPDSPQQPINCTNTYRGVSLLVPLLRFCALGSEVDFVAQQRARKIKFWSWDCISRPNSCRHVIFTEGDFNSHGGYFKKDSRVICVLASRRSGGYPPSLCKCVLCNCVS